MALLYTTERNTIAVQPGLRLPLERSGELDVSPACAFVATADGLVVNRMGRLSLYAHGLRDELWRKEMKSWGNLRRLGDGVVSGPTREDVLTRYAPTGEVLGEVRVKGYLQAADEECVVTSADRELVATEWSGKERWRRPMLPGHVLLHQGRAFIVHEIGRTLVCLDGASGTDEWELRAPQDRKQPNDWYLAGFPSVAIAGGELVVIGRDGRVQLVDQATGAVKGMVTPPYLGSFLVSETDVYFFRLAGWSRLDLATLTEVARAEYDHEVTHMKGRVLPTAFWISEESIFFTTMAGEVMGVSREADAAGRRWWSDEVGGIMPIAEPPVHESGWLYVGTKSDPGGKRTPGRLVCYRSVHA